MDDELTAVRAPHGVAVRYSPDGNPGLWHEVVRLSGDRLGVAVGYSADPRDAARLRSQIRRALEDSTGSGWVSGVVGGGATAVCGVIDRAGSLISYATLGDTAPVIAVPGTGCRVLESPSDGLSSAALPPGATVLLCTGTVVPVADLLDGCATAHPDHAADQLIGQLSQDAVAVVYRHPPAPLDLNVPAEPTSLAGIRDQLRRWLALAGVDPEPAADALLAVGEAASNAAEHAVVGAARAVRLRVQAAVVDNQLRFTVSDDGVWKAPAEAFGHRGHGIKLINALVDTADVVTSEHGTTVEMRKELSR